MSDLLDRLEATAGEGLVHVVIDTPSASGCKFKYDEKNGCYRVSRILPLGAVFPYNFGSIPRTAAEDGDPLDVLVLAEAPLFAGCLVNVKLVGVLMARQKDSGREIRNDRLLGSVVTEVNRPVFEHIDQIGAMRLAEIEHFFVSYNQVHGREYTPLGRGTPDDAEKALRQAQERYAQRK